MPEVLRLEIPTGAVRSLVQPRAVLDPATTAEVDRLVARARAEAFAEGEVAGRRAAGAEASAAVAAVRDACAGVRAELAAQRQEATRASLALAEAVATAVLDTSPPPAAAAVLDRVSAAAAGLDDDPLEVRLHPADHAALADHGGDDPRLRFAADPGLGRGEAQLRGAFGGADLTRRRLLEAALAVLGDGAA